MWVIAVQIVARIIATVVDVVIVLKLGGKNW